MLCVVGALAVATVFMFVREQPGRWWLAVLALGVVVAVIGWQAREGRHTAWAEAEASISPTHAVVLWKPGCGYCERLLVALKDDPRITWVNVWEDDEANRVTRSHNGGNELTPTVLVGDQVLINPTASMIRDALDAGERSDAR